MKRIWLVLLSLSLVVVFSTAALAQVSVKASGEFIVGGMYIDKTSLQKDTAVDNPSTAFYFQRLRLNTVFTVSPGLTLTTRMDIMERVWGAARSAPGTAAESALSAGTRAENQNIAVDLAYVTYTSPIGMFKAGYIIDGVWGPVFGNSAMPTGRLDYTMKIGSVAFGLVTAKYNERSRTAINSAVASDLDNTAYTAWAVYFWKYGHAAMLYKYYNDKTNRDLVSGPLNLNYDLKYHVLSPFVTAKIGPVSMEAQIYYLIGKVQFEDSALPWIPYLPSPSEIDMSALSAYVNATADLGMFYAGGTVAYISGDDPGTPDKLEGALTGGLDWNPCLLMFNNDRNYWAGGISGHNGSNQRGEMSNAWFFQVRAGVKPIEKLDIMASLSYAHADKKPSAAWLYNAYGYEVDVTATYKITNNLSYMLGVGYLFTGDYYKGTSELNNVGNDYLVINKLTLNF